MYDRLRAAGAPLGLRHAGSQGARQPAPGEGLPRLRARHRQHRHGRSRPGLGSPSTSASPAASSAVTPSPRERAGGLRGTPGPGAAQRPRADDAPRRGRAPRRATRRLRARRGLRAHARRVGRPGDGRAGAGGAAARPGVGRRGALGGRRRRRPASRPRLAEPLYDPRSERVRGSGRDACSTSGFGCHTRARVSTCPVRPCGSQGFRTREQEQSGGYLHVNTHEVAASRTRSRAGPPRSRTSCTR